jgi:hypothetical protein
MNSLLASNIGIALWAVLIAVALLALPYVVFPMLIKKRFFTPAEPTMLPFDVSENPPPREVAAFFDRVEGALAPLGFRFAGHLANHAEYGNVTMFVKLLENRRTNDSVMVIAAFAMPVGRLVNPPPIREQVITFLRRFDDGAEIRTGNSNVVQVFKSIPGKLSFGFPQISDGRTLFALHQCAAKEFGMSRVVPLPPPERMHDLVRDNMRRELSDQVPVGYLRLNATGDRYLATWKGAYMMTWPLLQPFKNWQITRRRRRAVKLMQQWGPQLAEFREWQTS